MDLGVKNVQKNLRIRENKHRHTNINKLNFKRNRNY